MELKLFQAAVVEGLDRRFAAAGGAGVVPTRAEAVAFLAPTALAQCGNALLYNQVPLFANLRMGNEIGAVAEFSLAAARMRRPDPALPVATAAFTPVSFNGSSEPEGSISPR